MMTLTRCAGWTAIAVVAIAAIAVVGCGGSDGDGGGQTQNTGTITGTVVHGGTGQPLGGINVAAGGVTTTTDANGNFTLRNVPVGQQVLTISADPARDLILPPPADPIVVQVQDGQTTHLTAPILMIDGPDAPPAPPV
ncbi:MAG: carboxypeptidase regulatory-like domain-containing protein [Armatimonadetes bacterium]|nr:carboxypeptidase regulatory-like domain-containing protein [Armatimonadota bacterium]